MKTILNFIDSRTVTSPFIQKVAAAIPGGSVVLPKWYLPTIVGAGAVAKAYPAAAEVAMQSPSLVYSTLATPLLISPGQEEVDTLMRNKLYLAQRNRLRQIQAELVAKYLAENIEKVEKELDTDDNKEEK
jgi:hypothetical protein